jgi:hypothetical protein
MVDGLLSFITPLDNEAKDIAMFVLIVSKGNRTQYFGFIGIVGCDAG